MNALEIKVTGVPAKLEANFEEVHAALKAELKKYDLLVTAETLGEAKKLATELNKMATHIDTLRKDEVAKASQPVRAFDEKMKSLVMLCKDGRAKLTGQIERFNIETLKHCWRKLDEFLVEQWEYFKVAPAFRNAAIDDLVIISNLTATGNLTSKACDAVVARVVVDNKEMRMVQDRLAMLDKASLAAGLDAPIVRSQVEHFLLVATDEEFERRLSEVARQAKESQDQAEARMRERLEREQEARRDADKTPETDAPLSPGLHPSAQPSVPHIPQRGAPGFLQRTVTVTFAVNVSTSVTPAQIEEQLREKMEAAGFKNIFSISVQ